MRKQLPCAGCSLVGIVLLFGSAACSSNASHPGGGTDGGKKDSSTTPTDGAQNCKAGTPSSYVLIDDMETTTHGPIQLTTGINAPLSAGYWYNSGASYMADAGSGGDTSSPPQGSFMFTALQPATTTLNCKPSAHAARQACVLNGLYDTCGVGFEFAQQPVGDAAAPSAAGGASGNADGGPPIPRVTVPFDISRYKSVKFWGKTTTPDPNTGSLQVKVQFPDTDTDPRGEVCNGAGPNTSKCYNSYAAFFKFTTEWQEFTVLLDAGGDGGAAPDGGIAIDPTWGYQAAKWLPTQVYGVNWQAQRNTPPDAGAPLMTDIWVDDVYFVQ
jgi:hypothetical protein